MIPRLPVALWSREDIDFCNLHSAAFLFCVKTQNNKNMMMYFLFQVLLYVCASNAAFFLVSNKKLEISPLQRFSMEEFSNLTKQLDNPETHFFKSTSELSPDIKYVIDGYYSAYITNRDLDLEKHVDLSENEELDVVKIEEALSQTNKSSNILAVVVISNKHKRQVQGTTVPGELVTSKPALQQNKESNSGPVIYKAQNKKNNLYALLYSSQPLLLKINGSEPTELHLGNTEPDMIIYDTRLNVNVIPIEGGGKVSLRFGFSWLNGYWYLPYVKMTDTKTNGDYNLTTDEDIMAPAHFSYHCSGQTVFYGSNDVKLIIYDLQVQTDSKNGKFGDANDCVNFTTAPIWSGLFVTTLLGIGLIIALTAIMDIKTMDKFDTKGKTITIAE